jgi:hypothetical protein
LHQGQADEPHERGPGFVLCHQPGLDPKDSLGADVGNNPGDHTVGPGENRTYTYYADPFIGETASLVWDWGNCRMPAPAATRPAFKKMPAGVSFQYQ